MEVDDENKVHWGAKRLPWMKNIDAAIFLKQVEFLKL